MFRQIKGQDKAIRILLNAIKHDRISQAYLFHGPEGVGKFTTALYFGMALNCIAVSDKRPCGVCVSCHKYLEFNHPDFTYIFPTPSQKTTNDGELKSQSINEYLSYVEHKKKSPWEKFYFTGNPLIRKESIDNLQRKFEFSQKEGSYRICIIEDIDQMNINTANSFLKTLEEPPPNTVVILISTKLQSIIPTIVSRCQLIPFQFLSNKTIEDLLTNLSLVDKQNARTYSRIANGNFEQAYRLLRESKHESRNLMISILESAIKKDDLLLINMLSATKDKLKNDLIHDMFNHLTLMLSDLVLMNDMESDIVNKDLLTLLQDCNRRTIVKTVDWDKYISLIDDFHLKLNGNVNSYLILIQLYNHLKYILE